MNKYSKFGLICIFLILYATGCDILPTKPFYLWFEYTETNSNLFEYMPNIWEDFEEIQLNETIYIELFQNPPGSGCFKAAITNLEYYSKYFSLYMKFEPKNKTDNGGWYIQFPSLLNLNAYAGIQFYIKGTKKGQKCELKLEPYPENSPTYLIDKVTTIWQKVKIPFSYFINVDISNIEKITFGFNNDSLTPAEVFIDHIKLFK